MENQENSQNPTTKDSLKVQALTQRIASLVSEYENAMADFRADATLQIGELQARVEHLTAALLEATKVNNVEDPDVVEEEIPAAE